MSSDSSACCTCASSYGTPPATLTEKPLLPGRELPCCTRSICTRCLALNPRYETYCPYCQTVPTLTPSAPPPPQHNPPAYSTLAPAHPPPSPQETTTSDNPPPAYSSLSAPTEKPPPDALHFLHPTDSLPSLALAYGVPLPLLRSANNIYADHLMRGRRTLLIPGGGASLSPRPVGGEEAEARQAKVRRWMVACKVAEYDVALLYLEQAQYELAVAVEAWREDERWEREHPLQARGGEGKGRGGSARDVGMRRFVGGEAVR